VTTFRYKEILILCLSIWLSGCRTPEIPQLQTDSPDVCTVARSPHLYLGTDITLTGRVMGYHSLVLYDPSCYTPGECALISVPDHLTSKVYHFSNKSRELPGNLDFKAKVSGKLYLRNTHWPPDECTADPELLSPDIKLCLVVEHIEILN
jgi:hypothetical protein